MEHTKKLEKVKEIVAKSMGKKYYADFTDIDAPHLGPKECYCIHRKGVILNWFGWPIVGKVWKDDYRIEVTKKYFKPIAEKIVKDLKTSGIESKVTMSKVIQNKERLKEIRDIVRDRVGKKYKVKFKDIYDWDDGVITYGIYRKTFFTGWEGYPLAAEIWTNDFRIVVAEESFKPVADELAKHFNKELDLESKVEWNFILKHKKSKQKEKQK